MDILPFRQPPFEPAWWYEALASFSPEERSLIERTVAPPSEQRPLEPWEEKLAARAIERFEQRQRFRRTL